MWDRLLSKKRYKRDEKGMMNIQEPSSAEALSRSSFHKDYDRIVFSNSFRRLSKKTQVHPLSKNDHVHNRLTHSLEVASVGRSLGLKAGEVLKRDYSTIDPYDVAYIVQTACLAHDIGNPPFGHAGEEVIKEWFKRHQHETFISSMEEGYTDFEHLDGNAQSFRIVSQTENNLFLGGMNLTFATLGTLVKYPYSSKKCKENGNSKFNYFESEAEFFDLLFEELGLKHGNAYKRHPLSFLMEVADDICYGLLDLQDAFELRVINLADTKNIFELLCGTEEVTWVYESPDFKDTQKISRLTATAVHNLTTHAMEAFEKNLLALTNGTYTFKDLVEVFTDDRMKQGLLEAKNLAKTKIFNEKRKIELELGSYKIIEILLDNMIRASYEYHLVQGDMQKLTFKNKRVIELMGTDAPDKDQSLYNKYQRVIDYIVGMTDNYATYVAHQLNGMGY